MAFLQVYAFSVCITVLNSPNPSCVYIRQMQTQGKSFLLLIYKLTFPRKSAKLFVMALIKREILTSHKVLYTKSCMHNQFLFCKKEALQNVDFSRLKCQLNRKKIDTACQVKIFQVSADEGMGINRVNLLSFQLKNFFKFMLALLASKQQNIGTSQPCLHTLMQTHLSANQSTHTNMSVIL